MNLTQEDVVKIISAMFFKQNKKKNIIIIKTIHKN